MNEGTHGLSDSRSRQLTDLKNGEIKHFQSGSIKGDRLEFSDKSVLALKASSEGPRRVLIVASRNQPITIRDALTGLFLRTICGYKSHTVYSLMRERNLVYCGTSSTSIPVFDFTVRSNTSSRFCILYGLFLFPFISLKAKIRKFLERRIQFLLGSCRMETK